MRKISVILAIIMVLLTFSACGVGKNKKNVLVIYSSHPLEFMDSLLSNFENDTGIRVKTIRGGTGELIKRVQAEKNNPQADILWGGSYSTVLPFQELLGEYKCVNEDDLQSQFENGEGTMTRFSDIPSVLIVNRNIVGDVQINGYEDLLNEKLKGKIAMSNPVKSSSSREHVINIIYAIGQGKSENTTAYFEKLCRNLDGKLLENSADVYNGVANGQFAVGLTFEEGARKFEAHDKNIEIIYMTEGVVSTPDGVYMIKNAKNQENAKRFIDYITSFEIQQFMVDNLNRRSVRKDVTNPKTMKDKSEIAIISVDYPYVEENCASWLAKFSEIFENSTRDIK